MEAYIIGACGLLLGFSIGWLLRARGGKHSHSRSRTGASGRQQHIHRAGCHMCGRVQRSETYSLWKVRGQEMNVCGRCHPYFKQRFDTEETTATDLPHASATASA